MNKNNTRDDFKSSTIKLLRERASDLCSNPDCRVLTRGASSQEGKTTSIGVAAHITAAAPGRGSARYDKNMSSEQRKHYDNGIWLCQSCSRLIDVDEDKYSVELLKSWKCLAVEYTSNSIGKRLITKDESDIIANDKIIEHIIGKEPKLLTSAGPDMLKHFDNKIMEIDPRFNVRTDIVNGSIHRYITAIKKDVALSLDVFGELSEEFNTKFNKLRMFGERFDFPADKLSFKGSKLFESISEQMSTGSTITIKPPSKNIELELFVATNDCSISLGTFKAKMYFANKLITIRGEALSGFIEIYSKFNIENGQLKFTYKFKTSKWVGKNINKIPFFPRLKKALPLLKKGGDISVEVHSEEDDSIIIGNTKHLTEEALKDHLIFIITYLDKARILSNHLGIELTYQNFESNYEEVKYMNDLCDLIDAPIITPSDSLRDEITFELNVDNLDDINDLCLSKSNLETVRVKEEANFNHIFGQEFLLPTIFHDFVNVETSLKSEPVLNNGKYDVEAVLINNEDSYYRKSANFNN